MSNPIKTIIDDLTFLKKSSEEEKNLIAVICYDMAIRVAKLHESSHLSMQEEVERLKKELDNQIGERNRLLDIINKQ